MAEGTFAKFSINNQDLRNDQTNYVTEIRQMMHGFGDCNEPLIESAKIIEDTVLHEIRGIVNKAQMIADRSGRSAIIAEDFIFLLRRDRTKLQRLLKYLELKRFKNSMHKILEGDVPDVFDTSLCGNSVRYIGPYTDFIKLLDITGELFGTNSMVDYVKQNRCIRAEMMAKKMDEACYIEFSKARCISFANKNPHKFSEWISLDSNFSISKQGYIILGYLAYEIVAQIVDLALLVRQDQVKVNGDSIDRLKLYHLNPCTYKPHQQLKGATVKPLTPDEIHEALRRFWSPQLDMTTPFCRRSMQQPQLKFLSC